MQVNWDMMNFPYGRPYDWADLTDAQRWKIIHHQLMTYSWWLRVLAKRR